MLVRRLTYTLLRRLERERRAIVGPARKPADRLRDEVIRSPKLQKVIADMAGEGTAEREVITARAMAMLREMEAALDMKAIAALDQLVQQAASRMFSAVEVDDAGHRAAARARQGGDARPAPVAQVAHGLPRSRLAALPEQAAAAAHRGGRQPQLLPGGADPPARRRVLHPPQVLGRPPLRAVVDAYVRRLLKDGSALEFFLEGGRSRTGKLLPPKLGLLSLVVDAALGVPTRTTWFCPVSIGYERFVEEKAFVRELTGGEKQKESMRGLVKSFDAIVGRYGRLSVQFGKPLSLADVLRDVDAKSEQKDLASLTPPRRRAVITRLAYRVMNEINAVTAVTAGSLVATALLAHDKRGLPHADLVLTCQRLARTLRGRGARFSPSLAPADGLGDIRATALEEAVDLFVRAGHVEAHRVGDDVIYVVPPEARLSLDLAKNVIIHFFAPRALIATALLAHPGAPLPFAVVRERVLAMSRLFKYEFTFRADAPFETIFEQEIATLEKEGELARAPLKPGEDAGGLAPRDEDGRAQIGLYADLIENSIEGYRVAARALTHLLRGPLGSKDLVKRAMTLGERMFLAGEIARREAVSRPLLENAYSSFVDQGYLGRTEGKLALNESYATPSAVATIESRILSTTSPAA